jgi:TolB-like protein/Flp pilus assembly protein TadD
MAERTEKKILESWKEISDYLKHSIKTCQRWEKKFGLPIHRLDETAKGRVFAEPAELDVWIKEKLRLAEASEKGRPLFRSLAVLPLKNLCGDKEKDYFSEGMTEALITELGQISAFRIISHQSVRQFLGSGKTIPEIAKMLRVDALVEGALLQAKDRVRLCVNFVAAFPERHIWAQTLECGETEVAGLQRRIAGIIAEQSGVELEPRLEARLSSPQPVNPLAYEAYLKGRSSVLRSFLKADIERALGYFEKAIELDPKFAPAYAEKGWAYGQLGMHSHLSAKEAFPKQKEAAQTALELDPLLAEGYAELGYATSVYDWDWAKAEEYFKRALELNPNSHRAHFYYAQFLSFVCRNEEVISTQHRLLEIDPLNPESHWNMGWTFFWARKYDESMDVFSKLTELSPEDHWLQMALAVIYTFKDQPEQALVMCDKARAGVPIGLDTNFDFYTAYVYAKAGKPEKAHETIERLVQLSDKIIIDSTKIAVIHMGLGNIDESFRWLEKAYEDRCPNLVYLKLAPFWKALQSDPRFQSLLRRMNFPE